MTVVAIQTLFGAAGCYALWLLWRRSNRGSAESWIVSAGFLIRALAGQLLFWISWLHLPIWRSLQFGNGLWFFAADARDYLRYVDELTAHGLRAILLADATYPSHVFVQVLALLALALGNIASIAVLLNCAAYLGICLLIANIGRGAGKRLPRLVALSAVAFGPGMVLWSLQPLKDTLIFFLLVVVVSSLAWWERVWSADATSWRQAIWCALVMTLALYGIAGIRWYLAAFLLALCVPFFLLIGLRSGRRARSLAAGALLLLLFSQAFRFGGENDVPPTVLHFVAPHVETEGYTTSVVAHAASMRRGFESTGGATVIEPGPVLQPSAVAKKKNTSRSQLTEAAKAPATPRVRTRWKRWQSDAPRPADGLRVLSMGLAAMFLPPWLAETMGLIRVGGGRGLWLFVNVDAVVFDAVIAFAFVQCVHAIRSRARVTPLFLLLIALFGITAVPMAYTVMNFGTLFRLREMVYVMALLIPLALDSESR